MLISSTLNRMVNPMVLSKETLREYYTIMDPIVENSNAIYRDLVFNDPHFYQYFFAASPIKEISSLNIGSRPAARKTITDINGLTRNPLGILLVTESYYVTWMVWHWFSNATIHRSKSRKKLSTITTNVSNVAIF